MSVAGRKHVRSIILATTLLVSAILGFRYWRNESRANSLVNQFLVTTVDELPRLLGQIDRERKLVEPKLRDRLKDGFEDDRVRFLAALALPVEEELPPDVIPNHLRSARLDFIRMTRDLRPDWINRFEDDWTNVLSDSAVTNADRLRAGLFLAGRKPSDAGDEESGLDPSIDDNLAFLAGVIVDESLSNKFSYADLIELARPMRQALTPELISISWDAEQVARQDAAITLIRDLNAEDPVALLDAALDLPGKVFYEIVQAADLGQLTATQIEGYLSTDDDGSRQIDRRMGRAIALGAAIATSKRTRSPSDDFDWASKMVELTRTVRDDLSTASLIHSLVPLEFDPERLFDSVFDSNPGLRSVQLFVLGEVLQSQEVVSEGFKNRCRSVARERFRSDSDPGVFSAARWLLVRLEDQDWMESELADRIERTDEPERSVSPSNRLRINVQGVPMVRFPAGTIAAAPRSQDISIPDPNWTDPLPYEIEVATDEVTVKKFKEYDPTYEHGPELRSQVENIPVGVVSWEEAIAYCNWLTLQDGMSESDFAYEIDAEGNSRLRSDFASRRGYRLPTVREWLAIWNADPSRVGCIMDDALVESYARILPFSEDMPEPVGGVKPDRNGVFHLAGNAHEWCSDRLADDHRALRGIFYGWGLKERNLITGSRWMPGKINWIRNGFRVVRSTAGESSSN